MEPLNHDCGVVMIRLLKPLKYYQGKYGTWQYPMQKLYLMMEKQKNRGQEGAGIACVKMNAKPGEEYMFRERALGSSAIPEVFNTTYMSYAKNYTKEQINDADFATCNMPFAGELYIGHLRYSTTGKNGISYLHPFLRRNNWKAKNLALCGNFSMINNDEVYNELVEKGQHPRRYADSYFLLEHMGHRLDREVERLFNIAEQDGKVNREITDYIENNIDIANVLKTACPIWDGGYVIEGITGSGESFAIRDPWGIRTAFWYKSDEIVVVASERPAIQTAMDVEADDVHELLPGQALIINRRGEVRFEQIMEPKKGFFSCSFERIYTSRGNDCDIYKERKELGRMLLQPVLKSVNYDVENTVFSFIPNTAEVAYFGLVEGFEDYLNEQKIKRIAEFEQRPTSEDLQKILSQRIRTEKVAIKDIKLRTFITEGTSRDDLAAHVYDITYGSIVPHKDNLVIIDDSIVRGTTLKQSILSILDRLNPKKIVIVSSSPQIRYPDFYGIDMESMDQFVAFKAAMDLLQERGLWNRVIDTYNACKEQLLLPLEQMENKVKDIYTPFSDDDISKKIVELLLPKNIKSEVEIVFQPIEGLHKACPNHPGDWYFTGNYPTPGGVKRVNMAFIDYYEKYNK
ncbi:MAG: amidophosphoribosyltransferase [Paludibacteraceae bacterium]|nr:amidophosphoribosyltransferase [Paludibacteraceae bacterium]